MKLGFDNLRKSYGSRIVFENLSGEINSGDIIGLIGNNGVGKTTLVKILAGLETSDLGSVDFPRNAVVLYVEQFPVFDAGLSVYDEVLYAAESNNREKRDVPYLVKKTLNKIGLKEQVWSREAVSLSGGEKTKLSLCKAVVSDFDFLLLDEPSNHLDMKSCEGLEDYISNLRKPVLIISHDRYFLDRIANKIWELTAGGLKVYKGNYSAYKDQKEIEIRNREGQYNKQQAKIEHLKDMINDRKAWGASAHKDAGQSDFYRAKAKKHTSVLKAKERELEKLERNKVEKPRKTLSPAFEVINKSVAAGKLPNVLAQGENLSKNYGDKIIFEKASFTVARGDKIALIGENGTGKTTFLRMLCHIDEEYRGSITVSPSVRIGYFSQGLENTDENRSILEQILAPGITVEEARLLLACLLFRGDEVFKKVGSLSMGEKGRVAFARLILSGANTLILDEPTNYMDIVSREKMEEVLGEFQGAVLFVSHDRYFIKKLAKRIFRINNHKIVSYDGDYDYYLTKCREEKDRKGKGPEYKNIADNIRRLENKLAFLSGQLNGDMEEGEKELLNHQFINTARELNAYKETLKKG